MENKYGDDNFLPGIYNYCDSWCEKCPFTDKCMNYSMMMDAAEGKNPADMTLENVFDIVKDIFDLTRQMLQDIVEQEGIQPEDLKEISDKEEEREEKLSRHHLVEASRLYYLAVDRWLINHEEKINAAFNEYIFEAEIGIDENELMKKAEKLRNALENIRWYFMFISVKIKRALHSKLFDKQDFDDSDEDMKTSAKLALIGAEKSLSSWDYIYFLFQEDEDELLNILIQLQKMITKLNEEFPEVSSFKRPYFDK